MHSAPQEEEQRALAAKVGYAKKGGKQRSREDEHAFGSANGKHKRTGEPQGNKYSPGVQNLDLTCNGFNSHCADSISFETAIAATVPSDTAVVI